MTKVSGSWAHVLTLALNDYSRPVFNNLRIVALYFHCDFGLSSRVLSQAAGWLWPEAAIRGAQRSGMLLKPPSKG